MSNNYIKELDGIRAIAAIMVMISHYFGAHPLSGNKILIFIQKISSFGQAGVTIFFVLSGFLITRILINTKNDHHYFGNFYMRRILRIFPLYFFFLTVYYFIYPYLVQSQTTSFNGQIWYWLYAQNISDTFNLSASGPSHFWSLAIEEQFYLIWPLLIYLLPVNQIGRLSIITILCANITRLVMLFSGIEVYYFTLSRMDELALGALLAHSCINKSSLIHPFKMAIGYSSVFTIMIITWLYMPGYGLSWIQALKYPLISTSAFFFIGYIISLKKENWLTKTLSIKSINYSGKISYGLYVYHPLCFSLINHYYSFTNTVIHFIVSFASTFLIAGLSYEWFESKFLRLKGYFNYKN